MKKFMFLVFIPSLCFSQSFDELMQINSQNTFVRYMVENGFGEDLTNDDETMIYRLNPKKIGGKKYMDAISEYYKSDEIFNITYAFDRPLAKKIYDNIYNQIKDKCSYLKTKGGAVFYSCKWKDEYKKLITIMNVQNMGMISSSIKTYKPQWEFKL